MHKILSWVLLLLFSSGYAQKNDSLHEVKGLPTNQIFDLFVDSRGFLWAGHDLGISRFDGLSFTHFSSDKSMSLAAGDLCEDPQGRIWCRNFSNQIFYIEHERMHLLEAYDPREETRFPTAVICGNKLLATSDKGLFECNTDNMKCRYIKCGNDPHSTAAFAIAKVRGKAVVVGYGCWYKYDPGTGVLTTLTTGTHFAALAHLKSIKLQPYGYKDTIYSFSILSSKILKIVLQGDTLRMAGEITTNGIMNTISPSNAETWVHAKGESFSLEGNETISGYDLSDLVVDKEGNTWYSSFKYGLLIKYKTNWKKVTVPGAEAGDVITRFEGNSQIFVYATRSGKIVIRDAVNPARQWIIAVPLGSGPVEYLKSIDNNRYIIGTSLRAYVLEDGATRLQELQPQMTVKSTAVADTSIYLATATGLYEWVTHPRGGGNLQYQARLIKTERCRSLRYDSPSHTLLVAFKNGVVSMRNNQGTPLFYNGAPVVGSLVRQSAGKFYIPTFNQGVLVVDKSNFNNIHALPGYQTSVVTQLRILHDTGWLLGPGVIDAFDIKKEQPFQNLFIPPPPDQDVYDLKAVGNNLYALSGNGLYSVPLTHSTSGLVQQNYLLKIAVNGRDTTLPEGCKLPDSKNSIAFYLSAPNFSDPGKVFFRYHLTGSSDDKWINSSSERVIRYSELAPGHYTFEAIAVNPRAIRSSGPVSFSFTINPVWYDTALFKAAVILLTSIAAYLAVRNAINTRIKEERLRNEKKLAIINERTRISGEIHDDLNAGLSGVKLLTELTLKKTGDGGAKEDIQKIYSYLSDLSIKMREVIWSLNDCNDSLKELLRYIQRQAKQLFENSNILLTVEMPSVVPDVEIGSDIRSDIYLSVKEALHNVLKHAAAQTVLLRFSLQKDLLEIHIRDNGKGMTNFTPGEGNGILNMKKRIQRLGGNIEFNNQTGTTLVFTIPIHK